MSYRIALFPIILSGLEGHLPIVAFLNVIFQTIMQYLTRCHRCMVHFCTEKKL